MTVSTVAIAVTSNDFLELLLYQKKQLYFRKIVLRTNGPDKTPVCRIISRIFYDDFSVGIAQHKLLRVLYTQPCVCPGAGDVIAGEKCVSEVQEKVDRVGFEPTHKACFYNDFVIVSASILQIKNHSKTARCSKV